MDTVIERTMLSAQQIAEDSAKANQEKCLQAKYNLSFALLSILILSSVSYQLFTPICFLSPFVHPAS
jgi:hypothetical protein